MKRNYIDGVGLFFGLLPAVGEIAGAFRDAMSDGAMTPAEAVAVVDRIRDAVLDVVIRSVKDRALARALREAAAGQGDGLGWRMMMPDGEWLCRYHYPDGRGGNAWRYELGSLGADGTVTTRRDGASRVFETSELFAAGVRHEYVATSEISP